MKKAIIGIIIAVAVIGGACYAFADSLVNSSASGEVASTVGSAIYNDNTKPEGQANKTQQDVANNLDTSSSNSDVKSSVDSNSANNSKGSSNTTENTDTKKVTSTNTSSNNTNTNGKAIPLTSAQLSKFIGTWTFGKSIGYNGGGSAYGDDGILNIPGKQFTIKENSIDFCGQEYKVSDYYITKENKPNPYVLDKKENPNPLGAENGYYTILTAVNSSEDPTIASINNYLAPGTQLRFFVVGDKLVYDDVGALFEATKN